MFELFIMSVVELVVIFFMIIPFIMVAIGSVVVFFDWVGSIGEFSEDELIHSPWESLNEQK